MLEERRVLSTLTVTSNLEGGYGGTLRDEIAAAQPGDTIVFAPGLQTITLGWGELEINKNLTIQGPGASLLAVSGGGYLGSRVFEVDAGANVTISGLTVEDGYGEKYNNQVSGVFTTGPLIDGDDGHGGSILNLGTLTLSGCNVTNNSALGGIAEGGGIYNDGTLTLTGCNVTNNSVRSANPIAWGGGIYNDGRLTLSSCNVTGNSASAASAYDLSRGGGIYNDGTMTLSGSAVTGNSATSGGGIFNDTQGHLTILSSVVKNNTASDGPDICNLGSITISEDSTIGSKVSKR
jgi:hypothetical protein